jgi:archaellum component FlaC
MKTNLENNMENILDLSPDTAPIVKTIKPKSVIESKPVIKKADDIDDDYNYARNNLKDTIATAQNAIEELAVIAATSEAPRAYEVLGNLMKIIADANQSLMDLQKKTKDLKTNISDGPKNVTNALFVGTTNDLQQFIKNKNNES